MQLYFLAFLKKRYAVLNAGAKICECCFGVNVTIAILGGFANFRRKKWRLS
jgi:hypothetical protein